MLNYMIAILLAFFVVAGAALMAWNGWKDMKRRHNAAALKAAEAIQQLNKEERLHFSQEQLLKDQLETQSDFKLLKWLVGFNLAFTMAVLWKLVM